MKLKTVITNLILFSFFSSIVFAKDIQVSGYIQSYIGLLTEEQQNGKYSIVQNTFNLTIEGSEDKIAFKVNPYIYNYSGVSNLTMGLREAYMDMYFNLFDLRIGKQQIVWGKADGVFITDIVSPKNLREFLLPDFEEIRMGVTAVKMDLYAGNNTLEMVWVPIFTPSVLPENNSIWHISPSFPVSPTFDYSKINIDKKIGNSEVFAKYSIMTPVVDFELMGGYTYDDMPTMHITKQINPTTHVLTGIIVTPEYHRLSVGGGSFSTTILGVVLRGEGAYYSGKYFQTEDSSDSDGVVSKDTVKYLVGLDYSLFGIKVSAQFIQQIILDYSDAIVPDEYENMATALLSKSFFRETLKLYLFGYFGFNNNDSLIRPKISYTFADGFNLLLGVNIFNGDKGMFGQYNKNDMVYTKIKYSF